MHLTLITAEKTKPSFLEQVDICTQAVIASEADFIGEYFFDQFVLLIPHLCGRIICRSAICPEMPGGNDIISEGADIILCALGLLKRIPIEQPDED